MLHPLMEVDEPLCSAADVLSTVLVGEGASPVPRVSKACSLERCEQVVSIATRIEQLVVCSFGLLEHMGAVTRHALLRVLGCVAWVTRQMSLREQSTRADTACVNTAVQSMGEQPAPKHLSSPNTQT